MLEWVFGTIISTRKLKILFIIFYLNEGLVKKKIHSLLLFRLFL